MVSKCSVPARIRIATRKTQLQDSGLSRASRHQAFHSCPSFARLLSVALSFLLLFHSSSLARVFASLPSSSIMVLDPPSQPILLIEPPLIALTQGVFACRPQLRYRTRHLVSVNLNLMLMSYCNSMSINCHHQRAVI